MFFNRLRNRAKTKNQNKAGTVVIIDSGSAGNKSSSFIRSEKKDLGEGMFMTYDLIRNGDLYRLVSPFDNAFRAVWEIVAEDKRRVMVTVVTMRMDYMPHTIVRLHGLDPNLIYEDEATGQRCSGALLMHAGLNLTYAANRDGASKVLLFRAVGTVEQA